MNDVTLEYYEENSQTFVESTLSVNMSGFYSEFLSHVQPGGHILDLGCGSGRDSREFIKRGFRVTAIDGSPSLCQLAEQVIGQPVLHLQFQDLSYQEEFDGIWACASLLHLPLQQIPDILKKIVDALKPNGALYLSFKNGHFEGVRGGRYYTDLDENTLSKLIKNTGSLRIVKTWLTSDARPESNDRWINMICTNQAK